MLQVSILSGKTAGTEWVARRFPVVIGRAANCDLKLEEDGVWDQHLHLHFHRDEGFILETAPHALATLNGQTLQRIVLRNGDVVELGSVKVQFSLSKTIQSGLRFREALTWIAIGAISLGQIGLIYWLIG
jgi:predicted component of type VI protein secretion system